MTARRTRVLARALLLAAAALALASPVPAAAQNPDLVLTQAERDSLLAHYDQIFPIYGRQAIERGFDMPLPFGINAGYFAMTQDLIISNLGIGFNKPAEPVDFIKFKSASATLSNINARFDLWLFPFLNTYVMAGYGYGQTKVTLAEPIELQTTADFTGANVGIGVTGAFGFKRWFAVADFNHQWAFSSLLDAPVPANIFSPRLGRAFRIGDRRRKVKGTMWIGAMLQSLKSETNGSINLADVLGAGSDTLFNDYQNSDWYTSLSPAQKKLADEMVQRVQGGLDTTTVNYRLDKKPADPWNMLYGGTVDWGAHWGLRYEFGFIGRKSFMLMGNYRLAF